MEKLLKLLLSGDGRYGKKTNMNIILASKKFTYSNKLFVGYLMENKIMK